MRSRFTSLLAAAALASIAACQSDIAAPRPLRAPTGASRLVSPEESQRTIVDSMNADGTHIMVVEYAAGTFQADTVAGTPGGSVASVTIRTSIPFSPIGTTSSGACITSTIDHVDTTPGWTYSIKKPGGCDKTIEVQLDNATTKQSARFSFLMKFGLTRIDYGAVR